MAILYFEACAAAPYLDGAKRDLFASRLPEARRARISSPRREERRALRAAAERAFQRAARRAGVDYFSLAVAYTDLGKPYVEGRPDLAVSFSYSDGYACALLAVAEEGGALQVGVDMERDLPNERRDALAERYFSPERLAEYRAADAAEQNETFLRLWVQTEAAVKLTGQGLQACRTDATAPYGATLRHTLDGAQFFVALAASEPFSL